jgi:hypothetical protein
MVTDKYFYFSKEKAGGWSSGKSDQRLAIVESRQPKYVTVLDLSELLDDDAGLEDQLKIRYSGPFYADWDCEDLMIGADAVRRFLSVLHDEYEVDPLSVQLYATGGRGYHIELPFETFCSHQPTILGGVQYLPQIYRELANELYTEEMDMAVYSAKRGRMWRTPNVERETAGRYKVPITYAQLKAMTPDLYVELTSAPRPFSQLAEPVYSPQLGSKFDDFRKKIAQRYSESRKKAGESVETIKALNGDWPDSVKALMDGNNISPNVGLNKIALQLGILSNALGKTLDEHLEACLGLIQNYRGDGHTTLRSVREELKRMYRYASGNIAYQYRPAAMTSIMDDTADVNDLRGDPTKGGKSAERQAKGDLSDLMGGIVNGSFGVYSTKGEDSMRRETNWHYDPTSAVEVVDATDLKTRGFLVESLKGGVPQGEMQIEPSVFLSADAAKKFIATAGGVAPKLDSFKAGGMFASIMQAARANPRVFALMKEGFNIVKDEQGDEKLVWASSEGCFAPDSSRAYRYRSPNGTEVGNFRSDVAEAHALTDHADAEEVVDALLHFNNDPTTTACVLGWLGACWLKPLHHKYGTNFPLLQVFGESGAGKTAMILLLLRMFYLKTEPKATNASQGTSYGRRMMLTSSSTIPYFMDEFKPKQMSQDLVREIRTLIHEMYTPSMQAPRGGGNGNGSSGGSWHDLAFETKTAPMVFSTETAEAEAAIQERTIAAAFSKRHREGRAKKSFSILERRQVVLSSIGKSMLQATMSGRPDVIRKLIDESHAEAAEALSMTGNSRIVYNLGVALSGLKFLGKVLRHAFGSSVFDEKFLPRFMELQTAMLSMDNHPSLISIPAMIRILRFMSTISWQDDPSLDHNVRHGTEFAYTPSLDLDINVDAFFGRYRVACVRRSVTPEFNDVESFLMGVQVSSLIIEKQPADSPLIRNAGNGQAPRVVRFSGEMLAEYNLGTFKIGEGK